jgi:hypothetical protein
VVILLKFVFLLFLSQEYTRLIAAAETRNYDVGLSFLLYSHAAIVTRHKQHVAVFADLTFIIYWQAYFRSHSYFSGSL